MLAIERAGCSFFTLDYNAATRQLSIAIDDPARADALTTLRSAIRAAPMTSSPAPRGR
jgi:hypothetical protein